MHQFAQGALHVFGEQSELLLPAYERSRGHGGSINGERSSQARAARSERGRASARLTTSGGSRLTAQGAVDGRGPVAQWRAKPRSKRALGTFGAKVVGKSRRDAASSLPR